eukprot:15436336-Alexandrium_andersonii.AAC.1
MWRPSPLRGPQMPVGRSGIPSPPGPRMPAAGAVGAGPDSSSPRMPVVEGVGSRDAHVSALRREAPSVPVSASPVTTGHPRRSAGAGLRFSDGHCGPPIPWAETLPARAAMAAADMLVVRTNAAAPLTQADPADGGAGAWP